MKSTQHFCGSMEVQGRSTVRHSPAPLSTTEAFTDSNGYGSQDFAVVALLKDCSRRKDLDRGAKLHMDILKAGMLSRNPYLASALISMYAKCGVFGMAEEVLDMVPTRDTVSWNALIGGYATQGHDHEAINCFARMQTEGSPPDAITFSCVLKACGSARSVEEGKRIHDEVARRGLLKTDVVLGNALIDMYVKCGLLEKAQQVLEGLRVRNVISWSALIAGFAQHQQAPQALKCFESMQSEGFSPDAVTFTCILKACGGVRAVDKGKEIHDEIVRRGFLENDVILGNSLVDMYCKCGVLAKAQQVLEELPRRNAASWSALIVGYIEYDQAHKALSCFERMQSEGLSPDSITLICILKACGSIGALDKGKQVHDKIRDTDLLQKDIVLGSALVNMYAKCGLPVKAEQVLRELPLQNVVSWSVVIDGYAQQGQGREALNCFSCLQREGFFPDVVTFTSLLKACGSIGAIDKGKQIHNEIMSRGLLEKDIMLGTGLIDMYAKCGALGKAQEVLTGLPRRDVITWNALVSGYAQQRLGPEALSCFQEMQKQSISPDEVTFLCVLTSCCHSGLLKEAEVLFGNMQKQYGLTPKIEHYTCMVVVFGSAGLFDKALSLIQVMPSSENPVVWLALLGACRKWGNVELGTLAFDQTVQLDNSCIAAYILMANTFIAAGMREDAEKVEAMRLKYTGLKHQGTSVWVDMSGNMHSFPLKDPQNSRSILKKAKNILLRMSQNGYVFASLSEKSEILAIACALINASQEETIYIMNSIPICAEYHAAIGIISELERRKITLKDPGSVHVFDSSSCACAAWKK